MAHAKTFTKPLTDRQVDICAAILAPLFHQERDRSPKLGERSPERESA